MPKFIDFKPLSSQLKTPEFLISDYAKFDRPLQLHIGFQALDKFAQNHNGELPKPKNEADAEDVFSIAKKLAATYEDKP